MERVCVTYMFHAKQCAVELVLVGVTKVGRNSLGGVLVDHFYRRHNGMNFDWRLCTHCASLHGGLKAWSRTIDNAMIWINLVIVVSIWVGVFVFSIRLLGVTMVVNLCLFCLRD
jgi:hypothetical protein